MDRKLGFILSLASLTLWYACWFNINMVHKSPGDTVNWLSLYGDRLTTFDWVGVLAISITCAALLIDSTSIMIRQKSFGIIPALRSRKT